MTTRSIYCNGLSNGRIRAKLDEKIPGRERTILAEGDSWFAIPTPFDIYPTTILFTLDLRRKTGIIDLSHIGDKATAMASGDQYLQLKEVITGEPSIKLDAILLSAGGNDVIDKVEQIIGQHIGMALMMNDPHLESEHVEALLRVVEQEVVEVFWDIEASIRKICDLRVGHNHDVPVIIHGYGHITPREAPARLFSGTDGIKGPWLKKRLDALGIHDPAVQKVLADRVINRLNEFYQAYVAHPAITNVHYVDLRHLVAEAKLGELRPTANWNDEIHLGVKSLRSVATSAYEPLLNSWFG